MATSKSTHGNSYGLLSRADGAAVVDDRHLYAVVHFRFEIKGNVESVGHVAGAELDYLRVAISWLSTQNRAERHRLTARGNKTPYKYV